MITTSSAQGLTKIGREPLMNPMSHDDIVRGDDGLFIGDSVGPLIAPPK